MRPVQGLLAQSHFCRRKLRYAGPSGLKACLSRRQTLISGRVLGTACAAMHLLCPALQRSSRINRRHRISRP